MRKGIFYMLVMAIKKIREDAQEALKAEVAMLCFEAINHPSEVALGAVRKLSQQQFNGVSWGWTQFQALINIAADSKDPGVREEAHKSVLQIVKVNPKFLEDARNAFPEDRVLNSMPAPKPYVRRLVETAIKGDEKAALDALHELQCDDFRRSGVEKYKAFIEISYKSPHQEVALESLESREKLQSGGIMRNLSSEERAEVISLQLESRSHTISNLNKQVVGVFEEIEDYYEKCKSDKTKVNIKWEKDTLKVFFYLMMTANSNVADQLGFICDMTQYMVEKNPKLRGYVRENLTAVIGTMNDKTLAAILVALKNELDQTKASSE